MKKGKNGQQIAQENLAKVKDWVESRNLRRDWNEYAFNNRINRRVIAAELDFAVSSCTQNKDIREVLEAADALWFNSEGIEKAAHEAARDRSETKAGQLSSETSQLRQRVAELEAELRQVRRERDAFIRQQLLVQGGAAGFKL